jgi:hypothetical protein
MPVSGADEIRLRGVRNLLDVVAFAIDCFLLLRIATSSLTCLLLIRYVDFARKSAGRDFVWDPSGF